jgi:hypothetical protein
MPIWPFGHNRHDGQPGGNHGPPSPIDEIDEATPHRFRLWVSEADAPRATTILTEPARLGRELRVAPGEADDHGVPLEIASTFSPRTAAILRPLNVLDRAGIVAIGFEALDLVTEISDEALVAAVQAWATNANQGPHRHRLEVLAGRSLLDRCLEHLERAGARGPNRRGAWRFAAICVAFNTPGAEGPMIRAALEAPDDGASSLVGAADLLAQIARLTGSSVDVPEEPLAALIRKRAYVSESAARLAARLPSPLPEAITDSLCDAAARGGEASEPAIRALTRAAPTPRVHDALTTILASDDPSAMAAALDPLAVHWPDEARSVWRRFLESRSIPLRWAAEEALGLYGTQDDLPEAAAVLKKLIRTRSTMHMTPPRGAQIVALLFSHRDHPDARAGLDDLSARWDRLADDMREWLEQHHPELQPDSRDPAAPSVPDDDLSEELLVWPPPTVEADGDAFLLTFGEGAHHSQARERFDDLAAAAPEIEVLDGDREWLRVRIQAPDPGRLVRDLWDEAGRP